MNTIKINHWAISVLATVTLLPSISFAECNTTLNSQSISSMPMFETFDCPWKSGNTVDAINKNINVAEDELVGGATINYNNANFLSASSVKNAITQMQSREELTIRNVFVLCENRLRSQFRKALNIGGGKRDLSGLRMDPPVLKTVGIYNEDSVYETQLKEIEVTGSYYSSDDYSTPPTFTLIMSFTGIPNTCDDNVSITL